MLELTTEEARKQLMVIQIRSEFNTEIPSHWGVQVTNSSGTFKSVDRSISTNTLKFFFNN